MRIDFEDLPSVEAMTLAPHARRITITAAANTVIIEGHVLNINIGVIILTQLILNESLVITEQESVVFVNV